MVQKTEFLDTIHSNINNYGHHITIVKSGTVPRYAYTIGLTKNLGFELVLAGGFYYNMEEFNSVINSVALQIQTNIKPENKIVTIDFFGDFLLQEVDKSWSQIMLLGVYDFYETNQIEVLQILPTLDYYTNEIPNMSEVRSIDLHPIWKWLTETWSFAISPTSKVITNLQALQNHKITEIMRWESDEWEMFAGSGPDVEKDEIRIVPFGTMIGLDSSILSSINLEMGKGMWRDSEELVWNDWG
jgi:hypothetical protein